MKLFCVILFVSVLGRADQAPLDFSYRFIVPPVEESKFLPFLEKEMWSVRPIQSDLRAVIELQTSVKSQMRRGLCSIFSALGIFESAFKKKYQIDYDFSENYLSYIVSARVQESVQKGSSALENFQGIRKKGIIDEAIWPYEGQDWNAENLSDEESELRRQRCSFSGFRQELCLLLHLDPQSDPYRKEAWKWSKKLKVNRAQAFWVGNISEIKKRLLENEPLLLEMDFFYGAWNHPKMEDLEIGPRDLNEWAKGRVGNPTQEDILQSRRLPAGHSIVIVGYNDQERVYYFKNSWGTVGFGADSDLLGPGSTPGYGSIPYEYAHQWGSFYRIQAF